MPLLAFLMPLSLSALLPGLPRLWEKAATGLVLAVYVVCFGLYPFAGPAFAQSRLKSLETRIDQNGVCIQSLNYTCGPAAAVSALQALGVSASESELSMLARTCPVIGTTPWQLYEAVAETAAPFGVDCRYASFASIEELVADGPALAVVRENVFLDHCVAVMKVNDIYVTLADPAVGLRMMPVDRFNAIWRHTGIVLTRSEPGGF